jgi:hypothetical protein
MDGDGTRRLSFRILPEELAVQQSSPSEPPMLQNYMSLLEQPEQGSSPFSETAGKQAARSFGVIQLPRRQNCL